MNSRNFFVVISLICSAMALNQKPKPNARAIIEDFLHSNRHVGDISAFLKNDKIVSAYIKCILEEARCTADGAIIKDVVCEIIEESCATCSPELRELVQEVMLYMYQKRFTDFDNIFKKYDPESKYRAKLMEIMNQAESSSHKYI